LLLSVVEMAGAFRVAPGFVVCLPVSAAYKVRPAAGRWLRHNRGMTERRPFGVPFESWVERQIREAQERGEFDNLPGEGKPIPGLDKPHDELWWVKDKMRREGFSPDLLLPTSLRLRKDVDRLPDTVRGLRSEQAVRDAVRALNERIAAWLRAPSGPHVRIGLLDAEEVLAQWRTDPPAARTERPDTGRPPSGRRRWWCRPLRAVDKAAERT